MDSSQFTVAGMWDSMGPTARVVVIILAIMSIWSMAIAIDRFWRFHKARKESLQVASTVGPLLQKQNYAEAVSLAGERRFHNSHVARVLSAGLEEFRWGTTNEVPPDYDLIDSSRRAIEREALMTTADLKKGIGNLATISTTAPFIGLFGTVVGIINSFRGMAASGSGGLGAVSRGISEALFATALGLGVAIPAVWLYNHFLNKIERFNVEMTNASSELLDYYAKTKRH
ncbi:MAG TPA: MotA/TolQ/ExbB proton channel family protein [Thermoanaerobaculia bacterium]|nr:MotA/TolQ/ExbB proton channel family protein [Thermoanaerobaculia bacterium]